MLMYIYTPGISNCIRESVNSFNSYVGINGTYAPILYIPTQSFQYFYKVVPVYILD